MQKKKQYCQNQSINDVLFSSLIYATILFVYSSCIKGGACGVMVIIVGNGYSDTSSNLGRD